MADTTPPDERAAFSGGSPPSAGSGASRAGGPVGDPAGDQPSATTASATTDAADRAADPTAGVSATRAPAPGPERSARLQAAVRTVAVFSAQLLLVTGAVIVIGYVVGTLWTILLPVVFGLILSTVLWPAVKLLRRVGAPPALASIVVVLAFLAFLGGVVALIAPPMVAQVNDLTTGVSGGLQQVQDWLSGPPFDLGEDQIGQYVDDAINELQARAGDIANYALSGASAIGSALINIALALVLAFFFLKDGPKFLPWLAAQTGPSAAPHVAELSRRGWTTLSEFIRQQALVGLVDAVFIGIGLLVLGVPLVLPLTVITFFAAFIPIIGAFVAGGFAVLIALVSNGFSTALWVLVIVIVVQQIEGNVLQPILQGRGLNLHAGVVILAVTAGGSLAGITGSFLAVPVAALIAVAYRYARDELDGRSPELDEQGRRPVIVGDDSGSRLTMSEAPTS